MLGPLRELMGWSNRKTHKYRSFYPSACSVEALKLTTFFTYRSQTPQESPGVTFWTVKTVLSPPNICSMPTEALISTMWFISGPFTSHIPHRGLIVPSALLEEKQPQVLSYEAVERGVRLW